MMPSIVIRGVAIKLKGKRLSCIDYRAGVSFALSNALFAGPAFIMASSSRIMSSSFSISVYSAGIDFLALERGLTLVPSLSSVRFSCCRSSSCECVRRSKLPLKEFPNGGYSVSNRITGSLQTGLRKHGYS